MAAEITKELSKPVFYLQDTSLAACPTRATRPAGLTLRKDPIRCEYIKGRLPSSFACDTTAICKGMVSYLSRQESARAASTTKSIEMRECAGNTRFGGSPRSEYVEESFSRNSACGPAPVATCMKVWLSPYMLLTFWSPNQYFTVPHLQHARFH